MQLIVKSSCCAITIISLSLQEENGSNHSDNHCGGSDGTFGIGDRSDDNNNKATDTDNNDEKKTQVPYLMEIIGTLFTWSQTQSFLGDS